MSVRNVHCYVRSVRKNILSVSSECRHHANVQCYNVKKYVILKPDYGSRVDIIIPNLQ